MITNTVDFLFGSASVFSHVIILLGEDFFSTFNCSIVDMFDSLRSSIEEARTVCEQRLYVSKQGLSGLYVQICLHNIRQWFYIKSRVYTVKDLELS